MFRSIFAVVTGIVAWGLLWVSAGTALATAVPSSFDQAGITVDPSILVLFIGICAFLSTLAGWLTGLIAKESIMKHVTVMAAIQLAIGIGVQSSVWDQMPLWYHLTFLSIVVPMHLVGGRLRMWQTAVRISSTPVEALA